MALIKCLSPSAQPMNELTKYFGTLLFCLLVGLSAFAQTDKAEQLRQRKAQLQDEIQLANKILNDTRKSEKKTLGEVRALQQKIRIREELIRTIDREINMINREIQGLQKEVVTLEAATAKLKEEYAEMIRQSYKNRNKQNRLMFVLSSSDFSQAMKRMTYLKQIADYREQQVTEIKEKQEELRLKIVELEGRKMKQAALKGNKEGEKKTLVVEQTEQQEVVNDLKKRESELQKEIKAKQREADKLEKEIQRIITEELKKAREKAARERLEADAKEVGLIKGKDFTDKTDSKRLLAQINEKRKSLNLAEKPKEEPNLSPAYNLTPEGQKLAANFEANKGRLPWPVERGIVVGKFGVQPHPVVKGIVENNPHIEIATEAGAEARAAFDGEVSSVIRIPGANKVVLVRHGNYFTVYGNLVDVYVKSGDKITTKQKLGKVYTDKQQQTVLQFGLWKDENIQNPEPWLTH